MNQGGRKPDQSGGHGLTGGGPSQLGVDGSMRARDVSQPTDEEIAAAEETVRAVRRSGPPPARETPPRPADPAAGKTDSAAG